MSQNLFHFTLLFTPLFTLMSLFTLYLSWPSTPLTPILTIPPHSHLFTLCPLTSPLFNIPLHHRQSNTITWDQMLKLALTTTRGLAYLHSQHGNKPCIIHRDFKSHNVLVRTDGTACICDFGLAEVFRTFQDAKNCKMQVK